MPPTIDAKCPYCFKPGDARASRCHECAGEIENCPRCKKRVRVFLKNKFTGILHGGTQKSRHCAECDLSLNKNPLPGQVTTGGKLNQPIGPLVYVAIIAGALLFFFILTSFLK